MLKAFAVVMTGLLLAAGAPGADKAREELVKFQGAWIMAAETAGGIAAPEKKLKGRKLVIKGNQYFSESPATGGEKGTFTLDPSKRPRTIDSTPSEGINRGRKRLAIYEIDGDTLKVCYTPFGGA